MLAISSFFVGCSRPLPEEGSRAATVYRERCGSCHRTIAPSSLKYPIWETVVARMERRIREAGQPPLGEEERATITAYLRQHAG